MNKGKKLLIVLNESPEGSHMDVRGGCEDFTKTGLIEDFKVYPFLAKLESGMQNDKILEEIIALAENYNPELILWVHTTKLSVPEQVIDQLKNLPSKPAMGYWDGDIFQFFWQFLPKNTYNVARFCDVAFCQGIGHMSRKIKRGGCRDIRFVPAFTDELRFSDVRAKTEIPIYDVVLIGNNWKNKLGVQFPGCRLRKEISELFYSKLGNRYALFGDGYSGPYAKGPLPFHEQNEIYAKSKIMIGTNSKHESYYFSNRLPIAMSSGSVLVHNYEKGYEEIFKDFKYPFFFKNAEEAWNICDTLLKKDQIELTEIRRETRRFALENLSVEKVFKYMIEVLEEHKKIKDGAASSLKEINNPWIKTNRF